MIKSLLLFFQSSLVESSSGEWEKSHESQKSLDIVNKVDVMEVVALINSILRLNTYDSKRKDWVSHLSIFDSSIEFVIAVLTFNVTNLIVPPHDWFPVWFIIFKENSILIWIFSKSGNNVFLWSSLTPLNTLESKNFQSLCNVKNCSFFSCLVFKVDLSSWCIFVFWKHMDTALG